MWLKKNEFICCLHEFCSLDSPAWQSALEVADKCGTKALRIANSFSRLGSYYLKNPQKIKLAEYFHEYALETQIRLFGLVAYSGFNFLPLKPGGFF